MASKKKSLLLATAGLLLFLPTSLGAIEQSKTKEARPRPASRARSQSSSPASSAPRSAPSARRSSSPQSRGGEPRTDPRSGTWVSPGSKKAHVPGHRRPYYRPPYYPSHYYRYPTRSWGYWGYPFYWGGYWGPYWGAYWGDYRVGGRSVIYRGMEAGALDLDIRPEKAQVVIDGDLIGTCDDFDGYPDYLWLKEGVYELDLFLDGYQTRSMKIDVVPGVVHRLKFSLDEGESIPPSMGSENRAPERAGPESQERDYVGSTEGEREAARIWLKISPGDASVYLDGRFLGTADELNRLHTGMVVDPGRHLIQVVRPGFDSQEQAIALEPGDELDLGIDLSSD